MEKFIEVPFGAKDSELVGWEYTIPEGMEATIVDNKIVVKKKENEDDKVRKELYNFCIKCSRGETIVNQREEFQRWADWLEKQVEQNSVENVEPKFKAGDWIIDIQDDTILHINKVLKHAYEVTNLEGGSYEVSRCSIETCSHLWTIQDAKVGDVLADETDIVIFKDNNYDTKDKSGCMSVYCSYNCWREFGGINPIYYKPATKEQRDLLFQKMKEAGYEWDADKKEPVKIEQKSAWSEEDKRKINRIYSILRQAADTHAFSTTCRLIGDKECVELQDFLKSLKERVQPKQEWSEEDERIEYNLIKYCGLCRNMSCCGRDKVDEAISWLRLLKDRVQSQPKQEWSTEDEKILKGIIDDIQSRLEDYPTEQLADIYFKEISWLKFIKQRMKGE